jgi:addiction module HigA family antidote
MDESPGDRLTRLLADLGLTQAVAAERVGVTPATINRICKGAGEMTADVARRLGLALGVRAGYLLFGEGQPTEDAADARALGRASAFREIAALASGKADAEPVAIPPDPAVIAVEATKAGSRPAARSGRKREAR